MTTRSETAVAGRRLHPVTPVFDLIGNARQLLAPGALVLAQGRVAIAAALVAVLLVSRAVRWYRFGYTLDSGEIRVVEGVFGRKQRTVPFDRVQGVDIVRKLRHRALGLASVRVETAGGGGSSEVALDVVSMGEAVRIQQTIARSAGTGVRPAEPSAPAEAVDRPATDDGVPAPPVEEVLLRIGTARLALAGVTGAKLGVMSTLLFAALNLADDLPGRPLRWVRDLDFLGADTAAALAIVVLPFVWLGLAAGASIVSDHRFTIVRVADEIRIARGLLEQRRASVPLGRVQVVRIRQGPARRLLGMAGMRIESAGRAGGESSATRIAVPIADRAEIDRLLEHLLPGAGTRPPLTPAPLAARRRAITRRVAPVALVALVGIGFGANRTATAIVAAVAAVAAAGLLGVAAYRGLGHAWTEAGHLVARQGALWRETSIVPLSKAQSGRVRTSPLQRRAGLANAAIDVATSRPVNVTDAAPAAAARVLAAVPAGRPRS